MSTPVCPGIIGGVVLLIPQGSVACGAKKQAGPTSGQRVRATTSLVLGSVPGRGQAWALGPACKTFQTPHPLWFLESDSLDFTGGHLKELDLLTFWFWGEVFPRTHGVRPVASVQRRPLEREGEGNGVLRE